MRQKQIESNYSCEKNICLCVEFLEGRNECQRIDDRRQKQIESNYSCEKNICPCVEFLEGRDKCQRIDDRK